MNNTVLEKQFLIAHQEQNMQSQRTFAVLFTLRNLIDKLNENPDVDTINHIKEELKNLSDLQDVFKYLLVPSMVHLNNGKLRLVCFLNNI